MINLINIWCIWITRVHLRILISSIFIFMTLDTICVSLPWVSDFDHAMSDRSILPSQLSHLICFFCSSWLYCIFKGDRLCFLRDSVKVYIFNGTCSTYVSESVFIYLNDYTKDTKQFVTVWAFPPVHEQNTTVDEIKCSWKEHRCLWYDISIHFHHFHFLFFLPSFSA